MYERIEFAELSISQVFFNFIQDEVLPDLEIDSDHFWKEFGAIIHDLSSKNAALLDKRDHLQIQIDQWYREHKKSGYDQQAYKAFLLEIGYLVPEGPTFKIDTENVDPEIATVAGPQLVVPISNARYAINAANARWGSLYDALYGTDVISSDQGAEISNSYNPVRGEKVIQWTREFLDKSCPLATGSHLDAIGYQVVTGALEIATRNGTAQLKNPEQFCGYRGEVDAPESILLVKNGLHLEIVIDKNHPIGKQDEAGVADIIIESAISTIMDCEDSVAAVDSQDKINAYRNWLGLMQRNLNTTIEKNGNEITRTLASDRPYLAPDGSAINLPGCALMLIRNNSHYMKSNSIRDRNGEEVPEGIIDAMITGLISLYDVGANGLKTNSLAGSVYIVKPKMHGPEEVSFACEIFARVEQSLNMAPSTLKIGIMDEERRTTLNLKECIRAAHSRIVFINTGFLDRTADEIHTAMEAGPMIRKGDIKDALWISTYEDWNVDVGLECGLSGKAQIGKGMWAIPDNMADMVDQKIGHVKAGANTAWVPSPTAATLHATHYHEINVFDRHAELKKREHASLDNLLHVPVANRPNWSEEVIQEELDNNIQGLLGYVVRWVDQGIGCSKVPDINNVGLMEDRATLRISSQHIANWLHHDVCTREQVIETMRKMALIVDKQNAGDPNYRNMAPDFDNNIAFQTACNLIFNGVSQASGYTEPELYKGRLAAKNANNRSHAS